MRKFLQILKHVVNGACSYAESTMRVRVLSRITPILPSIALVVMLMLGNGQAWAGNVTLKITAESNPSDKGYVYVAKSNSAPSNYSLTSDWASEEKYSAYVFGYLTVEQTFYLFASAKDGGWSKNSSDTSGDTSNPKSVTVSGKKSGTVTDGPYYAHFTPVTVNSVSSNPISTSGTALKLTEPGYKTADIKFAVSYADTTADFNTPTVSGAGWTLNTWSYANKVVTVVSIERTKVSLKDLFKISLKFFASVMNLRL